MIPAVRKNAGERVIGNEDLRFARAIFTLRETAGYLDVPSSTVHAWARPAAAEPLITVFPRHGAEATVPFIGFVEVYVLAAFRRAGLPLQRIRRAVDVLSRDIGLEHALASKRLYTDGAEVLYDYASERNEDDLLMLVTRTEQHEFSEVVRDRLERITYDSDGWASRVRLPSYRHAEVIVDPSIAFGVPLVVQGGARVEDLIDRFTAGDSVADVAYDFDVPAEVVEDVIRASSRATA